LQAKLTGETLKCWS